MITRKIKIGEFLYYFSRSIQNIAHHSQSLFDGDTSEGGRVCMSFIVTQPNYFAAYFCLVKNIIFVLDWRRKDVNYIVAYFCLVFFQDEEKTWNILLHVFVLYSFAKKERRDFFFVASDSDNFAICISLIVICCIYLFLQYILYSN